MNEKSPKEKLIKQRSNYIHSHIINGVLRFNSQKEEDGFFEELGKINNEIRKLKYS